MFISWGLLIIFFVLFLKFFINVVKLLILIIDYKFIFLIMNLFENFDWVYKNDYFLWNKFKLYSNIYYKMERKKILKMFFIKRIWE